MRDLGKGNLLQAIGDKATLAIFSIAVRKGGPTIRCRGNAHYQEFGGYGERLVVGRRRQPEGPQSLRGEKYSPCIVDCRFVPSPIRGSVCWVRVRDALRTRFMEDTQRVRDALRSYIDARC